MSEREEVEKERMRGERKRICKERGKKKGKEHTRDKGEAGRPLTSLDASLSC